MQIHEECDVNNFDEDDDAFERYVSRHAILLKIHMQE